MQPQGFVQDQEFGVIFNPEQFVLTHRERGEPRGEGKGRKCAIFKLERMRALYKQVLYLLC